MNLIILPQKEYTIKICSEFYLFPAGKSPALHLLLSKYFGIIGSRKWRHMKTVVSHRRFQEYRRKRRLSRTKLRAVTIGSNITKDKVQDYFSYELMVDRVRRHLSRLDKKLRPEQFEMAIAILDFMPTSVLIEIIESSVPKSRRNRPDYYRAVLEVLDSRVVHR